MVKEIQLVHNKGIALVDDEDYKYLSQYKWYFHPARSGYVQTNIKQNNKWIRCSMHKLLIKCKEDFEIDHIDRNGLNNQKNNLRIVIQSQNCMNRNSYKNSSSKYKGVNWDKDCKKWRAAITLNKKKTHLGVFINEKDAAKAYNEAAKELFGKYANLNEV